MSDLSWLNPTPHAIAVYASQPLSPVTTQHSLPSGRYALLGPDFHRLDRTSLRLAHLFFHLGKRPDGRSVDWLPLNIEHRAVARAIPAGLKAVPVQVASHMGATCRVQV